MIVDQYGVTPTLDAPVLHDLTAFAFGLAVGVLVALVAALWIARGGAS